ncbi:MAG TPA: hypothetical protein VN909_00735, partial [Candidatus Dormibacteraeota bacterium]|nr:hypothetical protein [Candidatus Dormibacteraeota bacterium]
MPPDFVRTGLQAMRNLFGQPPRAEGPAPQQPAAQPPAPAGGGAPVKLVRGQPVTTAVPTLVIAPMPPGSYTISVTATDEHGVVSDAASCVVEV